LVTQRLFLSFPEEIADQPLLYGAAKRFDVVPNIRRANVEEHSGWIICELAGERARLDEAIAWLEGEGVQVNRMEGDVIAG
jgi:ABC-type methionine transport system ATPase subunit